MIEEWRRFFRLLKVRRLSEIENDLTMSRMDIISTRLEDTLILGGDKLRTWWNGIPTTNGSMVKTWTRWRRRRTKSTGKPKRRWSMQIRRQGRSRPLLDIAGYWCRTMSSTTAALRDDHRYFGSRIGDMNGLRSLLRAKQIVSESRLLNRNTDRELDLDKENEAYQ
jgi:hypothetical protein